MPEYRSSEAEIQLAQLAQRHLSEFADLAYLVADDDPLRRAFLIARAALLHALWSSPVLKVDAAVTLADELLPHGEQALRLVAYHAEQNEKDLQALYDAALGEPKGKTGKRRFLLDALVRADQHLLAVLRGETRAGVVFIGDASREGMQQELDALCSRADVSAAELPAGTLPRCLFSFATTLAREFFLRYGHHLDVDATMKALAGLVQYEERLRRTSQPSLSGPTPRGGVDYRGAVLDLLVSAGCLDAPDSDAPNAREKAVDTVGRGLLAAKKEMGKLTFPNAPSEVADQVVVHEDPKASGCTD